MSKTATLWTLGLMTIAVLLAGCNDVPDSETDDGAHGDALPANVPPGFDIDDVPSLNLPEDQRDPGKLWCKEHSRYEEECYICHPELIPKADATEDATNDQPGDEAKNPGRTDAHAAAATLMCNEHNLPEIECGICQPDRLTDLSVGEGMKIRFASGSSIAKAGVKTGHPVDTSNGRALELLGEISFDRNALAVITPLSGGVVTEVLKDVGEVVTAGEILALMQSREIAEAHSEYAKALAESNLARVTLAREEELYKDKISARQDWEQAQADVAMAEAATTESRQHLLTLGVSESEIGGRKDSAVLAVRAPFSGTVIERTAVPGTAVETGAPMFTVADLSSVWMQLSLTDSQLTSVQVGSQIQARFEAYPGISFEGEIAWIAPTVNPETRMLNARAVLANPQGLLKEGLFGRASLSGFTQQSGLTVSTGAVQDIDGNAVVFRKLQEDLYESRLIAIGEAQDGNILVLAGLTSTDEIVTEGSYIVKSEFLKARMGAGCVDH